MIALDRLREVRSFEPLLWRAEVEAGVTTAEVRRRARENGLLYPPDPGAGEQSHIGGNVAINAGGPHAFKYDVTGAWGVTGIEAVLPPGEIVRIGGHARKDVAGYDLRSLLVGPEGTLGIVTAVHLRFIPAPDAALPVIACYDSEQAGCEAVQACLVSGVVPSPGRGARRRRDRDRPGDHARGHRGAVALARGRRRRTRRDAGGKVSEDIAVPVDRLAEAIAATREIARRHDLRSCSWGHAGDGNLHVELVGTVSGEHGVGLAKAGQLRRQWAPRALELHAELKAIFDPKGLLKPGKKAP